MNLLTHGLHATAIILLPSIETVARRADRDLACEYSIFDLKSLIFDLKYSIFDLLSLTLSDVLTTRPISNNTYPSLRSLQSRHPRAER